MHNILIGIEFLLLDRDTKGKGDRELYISKVNQDELANDIRLSGYWLENDDLLDGWGNSFQIKFSESSQNLTIISSGKDEKFETKDDIIISRILEIDK